MERRQGQIGQTGALSPHARGSRPPGAAARPGSVRPVAVPSGYLPAIPLLPHQCTLVVALTATVALCAALAAPARAEGVYKWTDAAGHVHYGDRPAGQGSAKMSVDTTTPADTASPDARDRAERSQRLLDELAEDREQKKQADAKAASDLAKKKANCEKARRNLDIAEHAGYLYEQDANGERRILTDTEHSRALEDSRTQVKTWCGG